MQWQFQYTGYIWPLLGSVAISIALCLYSWRHRAVPGATAFAFYAGAGSAWCLFDALELAGADFPTKLFWARFAGSTKALLPTAMFCFALEYAGLDRWLTRRSLALLALPPLAIALLVFTNDAHRLMWAGVYFGEKLILARGPAFLLSVVYAYLLYLLSTLVFLWLFLRSPFHRWPAPIILVGQLAPRGAFLVDVLGTNPLSPLDPAVVLGNLTAVAYAVALFRFHLFDVVPVARETVLERMVDGMLVLDARNRIADLNPAAQELLGTTRSEVLGREGALVLAAFPDLARLALDPGPAQVEVVLGTSATQRWYQVSCSLLTDRRGFRLGRLILLQDVTEQKRARELLQQQRLTLGVMQERERLARELHDGLGQMLAASHLQASTARRLLAQGANVQTDECLGHLEEMTLEAEADIREYLLGARTAFSAERPFFPSLRQYLGRFNKQYGLQVELAVPPQLEAWGLAAAVEVQLLRIIQEALSNVRKHARAHSAQVTFTIAGAQARITIADDGQGFDAAVAAHSEGFGLRAMRERAEEMGGTLAVISGPGQGTRVVVEVPWEEGQGERITQDREMVR